MTSTVRANGDLGEWGVVREHGVDAEGVGRRGGGEEAADLRPARPRPPSPKRCRHSDAPRLYILLVVIHTEYTGVRQNDSNV